MIQARKPAYAALTLLILCGSACRESGNVRRIPVGTSTCREIRVVERTGAMPSDRLAVVDARGRLGLPSLPRELDQIQNVLVSPEKERALVISAGEGHLWINVYRIADWLAPLPPGSDGVEPFRTMDPYPFSWSEIAWRGPDRVEFRSAGDYSRFDPVTRRPGGEADAAVKSWAWNPAADTVVAAGALR
jgi:hypothetical protein